MTSKQQLIATFVIGVTALGGAFAHADEAPTTEQIDQWVKQLDADEYGTRQAAQNKLEAAGTAAVEAVREAALGESQEAAVRSIDILKKHLRSDDDSLQQAAEAALKKLSESENEIVADRAAAALRPEPVQPQQPQDNAKPFGPRAIPLGRGGIRIEARAIAIGGKGAKRIAIKNVDGNKQIEVEEKDRKIEINESAEGKIKIKIIGDEDDMDGTKEVEAENAEELKKKDPEAYKIYEKYSKRGGAARIEFRALPAAPGGPRRIRIAPVPRAEPRKPDAREGAAKRFDDAIKRLEEQRKRLEERNKADVEAVNQAIENLEELRERLEAAKARAEEKEAADRAKE